LLDGNGAVLNSGRVVNLRQELESFVSWVKKVKAVVKAVWLAIRADFDLRRYYERLKRRKGANSAKVAAARRLLTIIYRMLKEGRPYIP